MLPSKRKFFNITTKLCTVISMSLSMVGCGSDISPYSKYSYDNQPGSGSNNYSQNQNQGQVSSQSNTISGQIVVKFKTNMSQSAINNFAQQMNARVLKASTRLNTAVLQFSPGSDLQNLDTIKRLPFVEYAESNYQYSNNYTVRDPRSAEQNGLAVAGLSKAWDLTFGDPRVIIAVIDTGIDMTHPDLKNKLVQGYNVLSNGQTPPMDDNGHGTHSSGIAAAETNNGVGIAGTAPKCKLMPVKTLNAEGKGDIFNVALGIVWAVDHGAKVLNLSLGGPNNETVKRAVEYALQKNTVVVAAMGNNGRNIEAYPAALPGVISVGSVDFNKQRSDFSNFGNWISVVAPGSQIMSTMPTYETTMTLFEKSEGYDYLDGTSMATPIVAGIAALILSRNPGYTPAEVKERIESTATDLGDPGFDPMYGHGLVNAAKAVL